MAAQPVLARVSPAQLLRLAQSTAPTAAEAREQLVGVFDPLLKKLVVRVCRRYGLKQQDREEVLNETYRLILEPDVVRFAPVRGKPTQYFWGQVRNAARKVMSDRGMRRNAARGDDPTPCPRVILNESPYPPADHLPEHLDAAAFVLAQAPPVVRAALELCYWENRPISAIAAHLGVSRFALARQISAFFGQMSQRLGGE